MSAPRDDAAAFASRPARGRLGRPAPSPSEPPSVEAAEVLQGQSAAVLGALARMQLRLDVLAREQSDLFAQVLARLDQLAAAADPVHDEVPLPPVTWPVPSASEDLSEHPRSWEPS